MTRIVSTSTAPAGAQEEAPGVADRAEDHFHPACGTTHPMGLRGRRQASGARDAYRRRQRKAQAAAITGSATVHAKKPKPKPYAPQRGMRMPTRPRRSEPCVSLLLPNGGV